jgi:hypothetical protein
MKYHYIGLKEDGKITKISGLYPENEWWQSKENTLVEKSAKEFVDNRVAELGKDYLCCKTEGGHGLELNPFYKSD